MLTDLMSQVFDQSDADQLLGFGRGIEREALRTTKAGQLSLTAHPSELGEKLTHPLVTTDFSEAQLELITPVHNSNEAVLHHLKQIHQWTAQRLDGEQLWPGSMPCALPSDDQIPLAYYGDSNAGRLKTTYRHGLGLRYHRTMQTICAVHYNFSFNHSFFERLARLSGHSSLNITAANAFRSERYFGLMRNFRYLAWLPAYLFGASPAVDNSFIRDPNHDLERIDEHTFFKPFATSLRSGGLGYQSSTQSDLLNICFNTLGNYSETLRAGITTDYAPYQALTAKSTTRFPQVNTSILQSEAEFYSSIRAKATPPPGHNFLNYLDQVGVGYIEVRLLDINPYLPMGVDLAQLDFMDLLLAHCMLTDSPQHDDALCRVVSQNFKGTTESGRKPGFNLLRDEQSIALVDWAAELFAEFNDLASALDQIHGDDRYQRCLTELAPRITNPDLTPSGQLLSDLHRDGTSFLAHHQALSDHHHRTCYNDPLQRETELALDRVAADSKEAFTKISSNSDDAFDEYLAQYQQAYRSDT